MALTESIIRNAAGRRLGTTVVTIEARRCDLAQPWPPGQRWSIAWPPSDRDRGAPVAAGGSDCRSLAASTVCRAQPHGARASIIEELFEATCEQP